MLAYEYLKQNPQRNASLVTGNWESLFTDKSVPLSVKEQLRQMEKYNVPLNDVNIYWYEMGLYHELTGKFPGGPKQIEQELWKQKHWLEKLYTYAQEYYEEHAWDLFHHVAHTRCIWEYKPTMDEVVKMAGALIKHGTITDSNVFIANIFLLSIGAVKTFSWAQSARIANICKYMSWKFLASVDLEKLDRIYQLCRDVGEMPQKKYESIAELERAHDERTEREIAVMLSKPSNNKRIIYTDVFKSMIEKRGFKLPYTRNDLIERSARHHNCVATYANKHVENPPSYATHVTRLVMDADNTAELIFEFNYGKIYSIQIPQYKGRYNKNGVIPESLIDLCIELTGKSIEILNIKEEVKHDEEVSNQG